MPSHPLSLYAPFQHWTCELSEREREGGREGGSVLVSYQREGGRKEGGSVLATSTDLESLYLWKP